MRQHLKIYYIANARMPTEKAHGIQIAKMCEALVEAGVDLELIVPRRAAPDTTVQEFYGLRVAISLRRMPVIDWYDRGHIGFGISTVSFIVAYTVYLWYQRLRGRAGLAYTIDIDQYSFMGVPLTGLPFVAEIHDAKARSIAFAFLFRSASAIVAINAAIRDELAQTFHIPSQKILVWPNGIDLAMFDGEEDRDISRRVLGLPARARIALYVGKLYAWKGLRVLADASEILGDMLKTYIIGGNKEDLADLLGRSLPAHLICMGGRSYQEVPRWLAAADVLLVLGTKQNDYSYLHTSPMKLFEYMASGRPIVASRTPANSAIVSEREAFFYEPDNATDLAQVVRSVFLHPDESRERARAARDRVGQFTWERRARDILAFVVPKI